MFKDNKTTNISENFQQIHSDFLFPESKSEVNPTMWSNSPFRDVSYILDFDLMKLDDSSKYDRVRRLTNCDRLVRNQFSPSKWKIYWWNTFTWEEYSKVNVSSFSRFPSSMRGTFSCSPSSSFV